MTFPDAESTPLTLIDRLDRMTKLGENLVYTAVADLNDPRDMALFFVQYAALLRAQPDPRVNEKPLTAAAVNISEFSGRMGRELDDKWTDLLMLGDTEERIESFDIIANNDGVHSSDFLKTVVETIEDPSEMALFLLTYTAASRPFPTREWYFEEVAEKLLLAAGKSTDEVSQRWEAVLGASI